MASRLRAESLTVALAKLDAQVGCSRRAAGGTVGQGGRGHRWGVAGGEEGRGHRWGGSGGQQGAQMGRGHRWGVAGEEEGRGHRWGGAGGQQGAQMDRREGGTDGVGQGAGGQRTGW